MNVIETYQARTARSRELFHAAQRRIPAGATRSLNSWPPYPVYLEGGSGGTVRDVDGHVYRDFLNNYTALPLGYADPEITAVLTEQLAAGTAHSFSGPLEGELAELLTARVPSLERLRFTGSGTEAVMFALRLARAFTGRTAIAKAEGGFHGTIDDVMVSVRPAAGLGGEASAPEPVAEMRGIPQTRVADTVVVPFNDAEGTERILRRERDRLAAVILEPVLGVGGMIPADPEYLRAVRALCDELGIVLIFDEVITLRLAPGGGQQDYGVTPDLTTMGKIIGGGLPIGGYGGRADLMALLEPRGGADVYDARSGGPALYQGGTFTGNAMSLSAGLVTMRRLDKAALDDLNARGDRLRSALAAELSRADLPACTTGRGSLFNVHVGQAAVRTFRDARQVSADLQHRFFLALLNRGFIIAPRGMGCVSTATTDEDVDRFVEACGDALLELSKDN